MLSGTEAEIINSIARLKEATKDQIRRKVGFSSAYIELLCRYLVRKGYLNFSQGRYCLAKEGLKTLMAEDTPKVDRKLLKTVAGEVAREISGELKRAVKGIKIPAAVREIKKEAGIETPEESINIKTDFDFPVEDESLLLESNINKIGIQTEKEKSAGMDKTVEFYKEMHRHGRKR